jgi:hypothetical protein
MVYDETYQICIKTMSAREEYLLQYSFADGS